ncbi:MAG: hydrogenase maturation nickel metallochaperone HypA [Candidatus Binatia bacterium]|nr:hydrogenase maturation nickel metallochaperone HypA [Candidatus Binatia bacterium]
MHEHALIADLIRKITTIAHAEGAQQVLSVQVRLGALCHVSADHLREHFLHAAAGTVAEGARLDIEVSTDITDPLAQEIVLDSVEVARADP